MKKYYLECRNCKKKWEQDYYRCPECGGILHTVFPKEGKENELREKIKTASGFWDYADFFPVHKGTEKVTMGEGDTPLVEATNLATALGIHHLYLKNEAVNPTGTFKDRCMSISFSKLKEAGAKAAVIGSAGNAGAAAAAYAARAGLPCYVLVPAMTPVQRIALIIHYGATVIPVEGSVTDCIDLIGEVYEDYGWHNVTTAAAYNPFQAEAEKAIAYEMAKQLDWKVPEWIAVPVGGGGILSGIYEGFKDLYQLGLINHLPGMIGVQVSGCNPLVRAFQAKKHPDEIERIKIPSGIAVAIADAFPLDGETALKAIYDSSGQAIDATDDEIVSAQAEIGRLEGIFAETASAATVAGIKKLRQNGVIKEKDSVVCIVTGNGVKEVPQIAETMSVPKSVPCSVERLRDYIEKSF